MQPITSFNITSVKRLLIWASPLLITNHLSQYLMPKPVLPVLAIFIHLGDFLMSWSIFQGLFGIWKNVKPS